MAKVLNRYKAEIDRVVEDAHLLANHKKSIYDIDQDKFHIIVYLKNSDTPYFKNINPSQLVNSDYQKISDLVNKKVPA